MFGLDDGGSLGEVCDLLGEIRAAKAKLGRPKTPAKIPAVVCGNKADLGAPGAPRRSQVTQVLGEDAAYFETSAKDERGLDGAFRTLASLGGLPDETGPSRHQLVSIASYQSVCSIQRGRGAGGRGTRARGVGAPCAALDPSARRPSFTSDLRMVLSSSTKHHKPERCQIQ